MVVIAFKTRDSKLQGLVFIPPSTESISNLNFALTALVSCSFVSPQTIFFLKAVSSPSGIRPPLRTPFS